MVTKNFKDSEILTLLGDLRDLREGLFEINLDLSVADSLKFWRQRANALMEITRVAQAVADKAYKACAADWQRTYDE